MQGNKIGRPRKEVDLEMVAKLAAIGCTQEEISYALEISVDTLHKHESFSDTYKSGIARRNRSLRHFQFQLAAKGNAAMCIFLGKNYLGQRDVVATEHSGAVSFTDDAKQRLISKLTEGASPEPSRSSDQLVN